MKHLLKSHRLAALLLMCAMGFHTGAQELVVPLGSYADSGSSPTGGERVTAVRLVSALGQPLPAPLSAGRIDLSALPAGIYYLSIITETTSYQHKIVKQ